jgi:hypothetical protein
VEAVEESENAEEVIQWMTSEFPALDNPIILKFSAEAAFPPKKR